MGGMILTPKSEQLLKDWKHQSEQAVLIPYVPVTNAQGIPEEMLVIAYSKAKQNGVLADIFPNLGEMNLVKFMTYMSTKVLLIGLNKADMKIAGLGWLLDTQGEPGAKRSNFGFLFFKEYWGTPIVRELARLSLGYWFTEDQVDMLYGTLLRSNGHARRLAVDMGFRVVGDLEKMYTQGGEFKDGTFIQLTKQEFEAHQRHQQDILTAVGS